MVVYSVYKASFYTRRGTRRYYVGMTGNATQRESDLQRNDGRQPAWLKAGCKQFQYQILVGDIPSKAAALATEALNTAYIWKSAPDNTRGGPWVKPQLSKRDVLELDAASKCKSLEDLLGLSFAKETGHLGTHLRGVSLTSAETVPAATQPSAAVRRRGAAPLPSPGVLAAIKRKRAPGKTSGKSGKSGKSLSGNKKRARQGLHYGTQSFERAKWGKQPAAARKKHCETYAAMKTSVKRRPSSHI